MTKTIEGELKKTKIYKELSKPLPKESIQRTEGAKTKKGYDTTGHGYQYIVNRFNEVLGIGNWNWGFKVVKEKEGMFKSGSRYQEITGEATIEVKIDSMVSVSHTEYGGHRSGNYTDALKGASTNAFKKTAGFFGVGKGAFEGSIDDDNRDVGDFDREKATTTETVLEFIERMKEGLTKDTISLWQAEIKNTSYNAGQQGILMRKIEELEKKL